MNSVQNVINLNSINVKQLKRTADSPALQIPVTNPQYDMYTPSFKGRENCLKSNNSISNIGKGVADRVKNKWVKNILMLAMLAGVPIGANATQKADVNTNGVEYFANTSNSDVVNDTVYISKDPVFLRKMINNPATANYNADTPIENNAKGIVGQRNEMYKEKFEILTEVPVATKAAHDALSLALLNNISPKLTKSGIPFANNVLNYKYTGSEADLSKLANYLVELGLSAEETKEKYHISSNFNDAQIIDTVAFKNILQQEFLGSKKPVKERTFEQMAESLTNVSIDAQNQLSVEPNPLVINIPKINDLSSNLIIPDVLTTDNIKTIKESLKILNESPYGDNVNEVMEHNIKKGKSNVPKTLDRKVLIDLTVDNVKAVNLNDVDTVFANYSNIQTDGLTGLDKRKAIQNQTELKAEIAQKIGISYNDIDYSKVDINDLKSIRDAIGLIQIRENAKMAISNVTKSMNDKTFPTTGEIQGKISYIDSNISKEVEEALKQVAARSEKANNDINANKAEITRLTILINDKKSMSTEVYRNSKADKSQKNTLSETIAEYEQQVLNLELANAYIQENLNMLNAMQTKLINIETTSGNAIDYLTSYKTALENLNEFDKKSAPVEKKKIKVQDEIAQKRFDKHNKRASNEIASDEITSDRQKGKSKTKLDLYETAQKDKIVADNHGQMGKAMRNLLNGSEQ